ncbi:EAL domain-containing protein [Undibacterium sp. CCC2.1]|nr:MULTISPECIES: EAL domain-containing protein [unclassified Undibacterium]MEB0138234.1 EAL domain-containing protein [Undibacterium sp. CCC2.1]MEB0171605.1 EAL domain-containing protein [Undibacterium sp. CCC1.1]MEB0175475.1 EAL domain-containing protein [Undibacterium sp. CCC3.4]
MNVFPLSRRLFLRALSPTAASSQWRESILSSILLYVLVLGTLAAIPSILLAFSERLWSLIAVDLLALAWVAATLISATLSFRARAWRFLILVYLLGIYFLLKVGVTGLIYLLAFPVMVAFFCRLREAVAALCLAVATLLVIGYFDMANIGDIGVHETAFRHWLIVIINFSLVCAVLSISCGVLLRRLEISLNHQQLISQSLLDGQASLRVANEDLRLTVAAVARLTDIVVIIENDAPMYPVGNASGATPHLCIVFVNEAFERQTGYLRSEVLGRMPHFLSGPETQIAELDRLRAALVALAPVHLELIVYTRVGQAFWLEADLVPLANERGEFTHWVATGRDISERKTAEADIHRLAYFDFLTGLPNRRLLLDRLGMILASARRSGQVSAVLFIDLDNFKMINDARGHAVGDALLQQVTQRLLASLRENDTVARIGGDEFVVLLADISHEVQHGAQIALHVAEKIRVSMSELFDVREFLYAVTCSIGVTLLPHEEQSADDVLREADTAMYRAKAGGRNQIAFYEAGMQLEIEQRLTMERELGQALGKQELQMYMQAQVDSRGHPVGAELLMRWHHPLRGMVSPAVFIPLAEESGLIIELGDWVLREACRSVLALTAAGWQIPVSLNVSPKQFRQIDFVDKVRRMLADSGADPHRLIFEVTEGLLIDNLSETIARMRELTQLGIRFSIDDFGTGYSSFSYLKKLPLYELKIDRSFVRDILDDQSGMAIVQSILSMAEHLGLRVVAEGVETVQQAEFLIANGCASLQGFLYSQPMPMALWIEQQALRSVLI